MNKILLITALFFLLISCNFNSKENEKSIKKITIDLDKIQEAKPGDLFSKIELIPLQTDTSSFIGKANKALFYKNEIYILDKTQSVIFVFNLNGRLTRKLAKRGRGPGEYSWIEDFAINRFNNNIELINGFTLFTYTNDCKFVEKTRITDDEITAVNDIEIINEDVIAFLRTHSPKNILYSRSKQSFIYKNDIFPTWATKKLPGFLGKFIWNNNTVNYHEAFSRNIYKVDKTGFHLKYELDFGKYNFDYTKPSIVNDLKSSKKKLGKEIRTAIFDNYAYAFQHYIENNKYIFLIFRFGGSTTHVLYNKFSNKYLEFYKGDLWNIVIFNKPSAIQFINKNEILALSDNRFLKNISDEGLEWFSEKDRKLIKNLTNSDNPVLIRLQLNPKQLKTIE